MNKAVKFQVFTASSMKMAVLWVVVPCSLAEVPKVPEVLPASIITALMMEARISETLADFYQNTWQYNPEDSHLHK
jgi:hypothetical protein